MSDPYFLHYEDRAAITDSNRVPLVLIHAFPVGPEMWNDVVELLSGRNLVVDLPGFGNTPVPDGAPNLDDAADALRSEERRVGREGRGRRGAAEGGEQGAGRKQGGGRSGAVAPVTADGRA